MEKGAAMEEDRPPDPPWPRHTTTARLVVGARAARTGVGGRSRLAAGSVGLLAVQGAMSHGTTSKAWPPAALVL